MIQTIFRIHDTEVVAMQKHKRRKALQIYAPHMNLQNDFALFVSLREIIFSLSLGKLKSFAWILPD